MAEITPINSEPAIEVVDLACGYGDTAVLEKVSFTVARGEVFFIIGGSGCGKSTLLRHLVGLNTPKAGMVKFLGQPFSHADHASRRARLKTFGMLFQGGALWTSLTISGGMRKRAGLARALALDPSIVFFDEPSAGLDPVTSRKLDELILHIRETFGTTIVIVSHELASIFGIADRAIMLDRDARGIIAEGRPREMALNSRDPRVSEFLRRRDGATDLR